MRFEEENIRMLATLHERVKGIQADITSMKATIQKFDFVTREELRPVKAVVYGGSGAALLALLGALIKTVVL